MADRTPTIAGVIEGYLEDLSDRLCVAIPARVERYDAATQKIDAQPLVKKRYRNEEDETVTERAQVVSNVPLVFPGAGDWSITFPVAVGDTVLLVYADRSLDTWLSEGGEIDPGDDRQHHATDAIAIPGLRSFKAPSSGVSTSHMVLGKPGAASDAVALATAVRDELQAFKDQYAAHGHNVTTAGSAAAQTGTTGAPSGPTIPTPLPTPPLLPQVVVAVPDLGSTTVKVSE